MDEPRKTVGAIVQNLIELEPDKNTVMDQQSGMQEDYIKELIACAKAFSLAHPGKNFFVCVLTKSEKLLHNVFRNYFVARLSCPTPNYDQTVYRFDAHHEQMMLMWVIPCKEACIHLKENALIVDDSERDLLRFVMRFSDGTLYRMCRFLNGEKDGAPNIN